MTVARSSHDIITVAREAVAPHARVSHQIITVARSAVAPHQRVSQQIVTIARASNMGGRLFPVEQANLTIFIEGVGTHVVPKSLPPS